MEAVQPKKLLLLYIIDILMKRTDVNHRLTQNEIVDILEREYNMKADRKSVKRNLANLTALDDFDVYYTEYERVNTVTKKEGDKKIQTTVEETICTDWYLERDFDDSELRLLIDGLLFSKHISNRHCRQLIEKLKGLSNMYFESKVSHVSIPPVDKTDNQELFYTISVLDEAIEKQKKVRFYYCEYDVDKKLHHRKKADGTDREYIVSPYQMAVNDGKYYLICNYDKYSDISNYRLDRIQNIEILNEYVKPFELLVGADGKRLDLQQYMREHIYMFTSSNVEAEFRIKRSLISDIIDVFGTEIEFCDETDTHVTVRANVNEMAMEQFAKAFLPGVVVLKPKQLVDKVKADMKSALNSYNREEN